MNYLLDFLHNEVLWVAIGSWGIAQVVKLIIHLIIEKKLVFERLFGDGGMPSCHSATVCALMVMVGYTAGTASVAFAIALVFAVVVMHDATGVRREAGKHAVSIKELAEAVNKTFLGTNEEIRTENLKVLVGHTPLQVFFGALLGIVTSVVYILIKTYA